jgi:hypothetical protein
MRLFDLSTCAWITVIVDPGEGNYEDVHYSGIVQHTDERALAAVVLVEIDHLLEWEVANDVRVKDKEGLVTLPENLAC